MSVNKCRAAAFKMKSILPILLIALGACTTRGPMGPQGQTIWPGPHEAANLCSDVIATNGGILKFCQTDRTVDVYESGVDIRAAAPPVSLIDDPNVLLALQSELSLRPEFARSRRYIAKSCQVGDSRYLTISLDSLKRMLRSNAVRIVSGRDRLYVEPAVTGSIRTDRAGASHWPGEPGLSGATSPMNDPR